MKWLILLLLFGMGVYFVHKKMSHIETSVFGTFGSQQERYLESTEDPNMQPFDDDIDDHIVESEKPNNDFVYDPNKKQDIPTGTVAEDIAVIHLKDKREVKKSLNILLDHMGNSESSEVSEEIDEETIRGIASIFSDAGIDDDGDADDGENADSEPEDPSVESEEEEEGEELEYINDKELKEFLQ